MLWIRETDEGTLFKVAVQPKGAKNAILGLQGDALKIKLTAPPVEGAANKMCIAFVAKTLKVPKADVAIVQGERSRSKTIRVRSLAKKEVESLLLRAKA